MLKYRKQPLPLWVTATLDGREGRFVQLGNTMLTGKNSKFKTLPAGAQMLYIDMVMEAGGKREFEFSLSSATKYGIAKGTFERNKKLLITNGFVECIENNAHRWQKNKYRFSFCWREPASVSPLGSG